MWTMAQLSHGFNEFFQLRPMFCPRAKSAPEAVTGSVAFAGGI